MSSKQALRKEAATRRAELARATPDHAALIAAFALALELQEGAHIASYWPIRDEADPRALMTALAAAGHALALPRIVARDQPLAFHHWRDRDPTLVNVFGIAEPLEAAPLAVPNVVLVPLLAFDAQGHRLGYGAGYYDRTLSALRAAGDVLAVGIAYAGQEVLELPHDALDERLDLLVTEAGVRRFSVSARS